MKGCRPVIPRATYFPHSANVYSFDVAAGSHIETTETALYSAIPCYGERVTSNLIETLLGVDSKGRWRVLFPLTFSGSSATVKEGYTLFLTADDGIQRKLRIETVNKYASTHIEVEANEDDAYRQ